MHIRYQVILLYFREYTNIHIAKIMDLSTHTVGIYINSYKQNGVEGLIMRKSSGCPSFISKKQEKEKALYDVIVTMTSDQVGFGNRKNWNANIARKWVRDNFHIEYSNRVMLQVLHRLNINYTRPTYTLAKADEGKQETFKQEFNVES